MKKILLLLLALSLMLTACAKKPDDARADGSGSDAYKDGTYHGESQADE